MLMGLEDPIGVSFVDPIRSDDTGWAFTRRRVRRLGQRVRVPARAYTATEPGYDARVTVPALWDKQSGVIVSNESSDILRMLGTVFAPFAAHPVELCPGGCSARSTTLNDRIYDNVNNAVYKAGFSRRQDVYEREVRALFATLDMLDARLSDRRFLFGAVPVETDWRLFTTLVRFDAVYQIHFKCSIRKLIEYEHLWPYARDLLPVARGGGDCRFRRDPRALLPHPPDDQSERAGRTRPGRGLERAAAPKRPLARRPSDRTWLDVDWPREASCRSPKKTAPHQLHRGW